MPKSSPSGPSSKPSPPSYTYSPSGIPSKPSPRSFTYSPPHYPSSVPPFVTQKHKRKPIEKKIVSGFDLTRRKLRYPIKAPETLLGFKQFKMRSPFKKSRTKRKTARKKSK